MKGFIRQGRTLLWLLTAVAAAVGAVGLAGCGDDNGVNSGGGAYASVKIGGLKWMKKNLNVETEDSWCYDDKSSNCNKYGRLYTWSAATSACESVGWRLPTRTEWGVLAKAAGGKGTYGTDGAAGDALKAKSGWCYDRNGTDDYGFSALPGGMRHSDGSFPSGTCYGYWWTATEYNSGNAIYRRMAHDRIYVDEYYDYKSYGRSVRCVQDE